MQILWLTITLLLGSAAVIYFSCEFFVNGVEWVGRQMAVGQKATGTILAAFGTALPESVVTFVAVAFGGSMATKELGIGATLGGPLVLSTIAMRPSELSSSLAAKLYQKPRKFAANSSG